MLLPGVDEFINQTHVVGPSELVNQAQTGETSGQLGVNWDQATLRKLR